MFDKTTSSLRPLAVLTALILLLSVAFLPAVAAGQDSWYKQQAEPLLQEMRELMEDTNYIQVVASMPEAGAAVAAWRTAMNEQESTVHLYKMPTLEQTMAIADDGGLFGTIRGMGEAARRRMENMSFVLLLNYVTSLGTPGNSMAGMMLAGNAVSVNALVEAPEQFENTVVVYEYDTFLVLVAFRHEDAAVSVQTYVSSPLLLEKLREIK